MGRKPIPRTAKEHYPLKRCDKLGRGPSKKTLRRADHWSCKCKKEGKGVKGATVCGCVGIGEYAGRHRIVRIPSAYKKKYNKRYAARHHGPA